MTKVETCKLEGAALDWAVAQAIGLQVIFHVFSETVDTSTHERPSSIQVTMGADVYYHSGDMSLALYSPSTDWSQGGPLIEQYRIDIGAPMETKSGPWDASTEWGLLNGIEGDTPLIAAMRAIVAAKLGDTVEVPSELAGTHP